MAVINLNEIIIEKDGNQYKLEKGSGSGTGVTPVITATATVDDTTGTPSVDVVKSGSDETPSFAFNFTGIKGEKGEQGVQGVQGVNGTDGANGVTPNISVSANIDNTTGIPSVGVIKGGSVETPDFTFNFSGIKGEQGAQGNNGADGEVKGTYSPTDNSFNIYSGESVNYNLTDERDTGYILNGKTVYEKLVIDTTGNGNNVTKSINISNLNIEQIISCYGIVKHSAVKTYMITPSYIASDNNLAIWYENGIIYERHVGSAYNSQEILITIRYTKI